MLIVGIKKFLMKEDMNRLDHARRAQRQLLMRTWLFRLLWVLMGASLLVPLMNRRGIKLAALPMALISSALAR